MDTRLYILAGTFALVVLSLIVLVVSLVRARRAPLQPLVPEPGPWPALMPAPANVIETHAAESTPFTEPSGGMAAVLGEPLRTGSWQPATEQATREDAPVDYWDSLIDDPALLVRPTAPRAPEPTPEPVFEPEPEPVFEPEPEPAFEPTPEPVFEPEPEPAPIPALEPEPAYESPVVEIHPDTTSDDSADGEEWLATLVAALDDVGDVSEVAPEVHVEADAVLEPQPAPQPQPEPQPTAQQEPQPDPIPVSELSTFGIDATPAVPATPMPVVPAAPIPVVSVPVAPVVASVPAVPVPAPVIPAEVLFEAVAAPEAPPPPVRDVPEYVLVAPVEMWFGEARVGVKPGSRTYEQFQRYASVLFDDLKRSTGTR